MWVSTNIQEQHLKAERPPFVVNFPLFEAGRNTQQIDYEAGRNTQQIDYEFIEIPKSSFVT